MASGLFVGVVLFFLSSASCTALHPQPSNTQQDRRFPILSEALALVSKHYVDPPDQRVMYRGAIAGMQELLVSEGKVLPSSSAHKDVFVVDEYKGLESIGPAFELIQQGSNVDPKSLEHAAIKGVLKAIDKRGAFFDLKIEKVELQSKNSRIGSIGIQFELKEDRVLGIAPFEGSPAQKAGIQPGDSLLKLNDEPFINLTFPEIVQRMQGPIVTEVTFTVERKGADEPLLFKCVREATKKASVGAQTMAGNIGYVRLSRFQESTAGELEGTLRILWEQNIRGLILDLRNNPGGSLLAVVDVAEKFLPPKKRIVSIRSRKQTDEYVSRTKTPYDEIPMRFL